jgi:hypothetical protein
MSSFFKDFQRGYRLFVQPKQRTSPRSIRFPYLDGIPQATPRAQLIKRLIKQIFLTLTLALIGAAIWGGGAFFFILLVTIAACYLYNYTHRPPNAPSIHVLTALSPSDRQRHTYAIGKTGAGKSTMLAQLILNDLIEERGVIVISPERGLFDTLLAHLPHLAGDTDLADRLLYFDPSDNTPPIVGFNPFHFEAPDDPHEKQQLITQQAGETYTILTHALGDLGVKMSTLMQNCIYALLQRPNSTLETLEQLIDPHDDTLRKAIASDTRIDERTRRFWTRYQASNYYTSVYEPIMNRLDPLFRPPLVDILTTNSFSFHQLLNQRRNSIMFFDLSSLRGIEKLIIGQLIISTAQQTLFRRDHLPENERYPYYLYIDEFQEFANTSEDAMRELFNRTRKYHVGLTLAHQISSDLPQKLLASIVGNVGTLVCMQLAADDARYFANHLQLHEQTFTSDGQLRRGRLMPEILQNLNTGEACVITPHRKKPVHIVIPPNPTATFGDWLYPLPNFTAGIRAESKATHGITQTVAVPEHAEFAAPLTDAELPTSENDDLFPMDEEVSYRTR